MPSGTICELANETQLRCLPVTSRYLLAVPSDRSIDPASDCERCRETARIKLPRRRPKAQPTFPKFPSASRGCWRRVARPSAQGLAATRSTSIQMCVRRCPLVRPARMVRTYTLVLWSSSARDLHWQYLTVLQMKDANIETTCEYVDYSWWARTADSPSWLIHDDFGRDWVSPVRYGVLDIAGCGNSLRYVWR